MNKSKYTICLVFFVLIFYTPVQVMATEEENDTEKIKSNKTFTALQSYRNTIDPVWGFYGDVSPGLIQIKTKGLASDIWKSDANFAYNFSVGYFHIIAPMLKVKAGLGFSSYKTTFTGTGEIVSQSLVDIDNDRYIESLQLQNVEHTINPMYLNVPVSIEYGTANISRLGYYFDIGFEYSYLLNESNTTSGTYSTSGYYPQWGVTLEDIPELGFFSEKALDTELSLKKNIYSIRAGAGITIPVSGVLIFKVGLAGYKGLNSIGSSKNANVGNNTTSQQTGKFRTNYASNPLASSEGNKPLRIGIEFGLYICKQVK